MFQPPRGVSPRGGNGEVDLLDPEHGGLGFGATEDGFAGGMSEKEDPALSLLVGHRPVNDVVAEAVAAKVVAKKGAVTSRSCWTATTK